MKSVNQKPGQKKKRSYRSRRSKDGFIQVCTALHESHIAILDRMVNSPESMKRGLTKRDLIYQMISNYLEENKEESLRNDIAALRREYQKEVKQLKNRQEMMIEMLAHYVRIYLGQTNPVTKENRDVVRARSKERFARFTEEVTGVLSHR